MSTQLAATASEIPFDTDLNQFQPLELHPLGVSLRKVVIASVRRVSNGDLVGFLTGLARN